MQTTDERSLVTRVKDSLLARGGFRHRRWRPTRSLPLLALGAIGVVALEGWHPAEHASADGADVTVVAEAPVGLPVEINARVEKWMQSFLTDQRQTFEVFLSREGIYAGLIRGKLRERGMPQDLLYLAMIESGFSARATSRVSAAGVWQFMGPTARQYGLRVDRWVDERRDPVKATDAALDYLQWLHDRYDSWYLAAAAYNAGPSRVDSALRRHGGRQGGDEDLYWEIIDRLPRETRDYVPKLLAAKILAQQAARYGFHVNREAPYDFDRVWVPGGTPLSTIASALDMDASVMRELNPHLIRGETPPGSSYAVRVPKGMSNAVIAALGGGRMANAMADE